MFDVVSILLLLPNHFRHLKVTHQQEGVNDFSHDCITYEISFWLVWNTRDTWSARTRTAQLAISTQTERLNRISLAKWELLPQFQFNQLLRARCGLVVSQKAPRSPTQRRITLHEWVCEHRGVLSYVVLPLEHHSLTRCVTGLSCRV